MILTANSRMVLQARISMPRTGAWTADLTVAGGDALTGAVDLVYGDEFSVAWRGTVWQGGGYVDTTMVRIVGGAGGLSKPLPPKFYRNAPASIVVGDLLRECGETLSPTSGDLTKNLQWWQRGRATTAGEELEQLVGDLGMAWRVLQDGTVWIGRDTYPVQTLVHQVLEEYPDEGRVVIGSDLPTLLPATTFDGQRVARVTHTVDDVALRTDVVFERTVGFALDIMEGLRSLIRKAFAPTLYLGAYPGRIVSQGADGSIDWVPDDQRLAGMTGVPIELGLPASKVKIAPGTRCSVAFRNGNKSQPYVSSWDTGTAIEISIAGGTLPVARQGDMVQVISTPPGTPAYGMIISGNPIVKA